MAIPENVLQQFATHNFGPSDIQPAMRQTAEEYVLARLRAAGFDVSEWDDYPLLVQSVMAMRAVGTAYEVMASESSNDASYGTNIRREGDRILNLIANGLLLLEDDEDKAPATAELADAHEAEFTIGQVF